MDFELPYEWEGRTHPYRPDFLVRLKVDGEHELTLIVLAEMLDAFTLGMVA